MRRFLKRVVWSLIPVLVLLTSAEIVVRLKYFFAHKRDWNYLTMPIRVQDTQALDHAFFKLPENALAEAAAAASKESALKTGAPPAAQPAPPAPKPPARASTSSAPAPKPAGVPVAASPTPPVDPAAAAASADRMKFKWVRPCRDREVFSQHYQKTMPFTWDANCFRGDSVTTAKPAGEFRIFVVGGSTVEDAQPDIDMWTRQLKLQLNDPRIKVVNAGQTNMGSSRM